MYLICRCWPLLSNRVRPGSWKVCVFIGISYASSENYGFLYVFLMPRHKTVVFHRNFVPWQINMVFHIYFVLCNNIVWFFLGFLTLGLSWFSCDGIEPPPASYPSREAPPAGFCWSCVYLIHIYILLTCTLAGTSRMIVIFIYIHIHMYISFEWVQALT